MDPCVLGTLPSNEQITVETNRPHIHFSHKVAASRTTHSSHCRQPLQAIRYIRSCKVQPDMPGCCTTSLHNLAVQLTVQHRLTTYFVPNDFFAMG